MGIAFETKKYVLPPHEERKLPSLEFRRSHGDIHSVGFSGEFYEIQITPREIVLPSDSLFHKGLLSRADYDKGYSPVVLDPVDIRAAVGAINFQEISIDDLHLEITSDGNIRVPTELHPLKENFKYGADVMAGLSGRLKDDWVMVLALTREILHFPNTANNGFPHCDHMKSNTGDGIGMKTEAAGLLPQIFVTAASFVGTRFYPTLALTNVARFTQNAGAALTWDAQFGKVGKDAPTISAPANHYVLSSDLHVHEGPPVELSDVPKSEQFKFVEHDVDDTPLRVGWAVFRELFHLSLERR